MLGAMEKRTTIGLAIATLALAGVLQYVLLRYFPEELPPHPVRAETQRQFYRITPASHHDRLSGLNYSEQRKRSYRTYTDFEFDEKLMSVHLDERALFSKMEPRFKGALCEYREIAGDGPFETRLETEDWLMTLKLLRFLKQEMLSWLDRHRGEIASDIAAWMEEQVHELSLGAPPQEGMPDLAWRGIVVFQIDEDGSPRVEMGGGFFRMLSHQPERARYELLRAMAMAWSPCEMARHREVSPWTPLTSCLGVSDEHACQPGSFNEEGWAVATTVASSLTHPGCLVEAFASEPARECLKSPFKVRVPLIGARL